MLLSLSGRAPQRIGLRDTLFQRHAAVLTITTAGSPLARAVPDHIALDVAQGNDPFMPDASALNTVVEQKNRCAAVNRGCP